VFLIYSFIIISFVLFFIVLNLFHFLGTIFILCKDFREAYFAQKNVNRIPSLKVFGHHVITVGGLAGRKPTSSVHNYFIVLVVVDSEHFERVEWHGKDAGRDVATSSFAVGATSSVQRLEMSKNSYNPLKFQVPSEV